FLSMQGAYIYDSRVAAFAAIGTVLGAAYMLWLYRRVFYGPSLNADAAAMPDLSFREKAMFLPLIALIIWMGVYPASVKNIMAPTIAQVLQETQSKAGRGMP
ncbi:MAG: NADH-quinone oxidoreductase subunit M, partial [Alphaproteobacteria bacterium]|nr:NADH-quinone oxidoreductase subunit M [Alphaproteobacteria bacterium]